MDVVVIPTNRPMVRQDMDDLVYLSLEEKFDALVNDVKSYVENGAPVLVGTATVSASEYVSERLKKAGIKHQVLNAKFHRKEAEIISQAGKMGSVTIATNMAGRGTDIVLGGNPQEEIKQLENPTEEQIAQIRAEWKIEHEKVLAAGGLHIIGTERHESRRIDNQLRGRAGRQGDPGYTRFYLSMEDDLMRIFASDRVRNLMRSLGLEKGEAIEHRWVTRAIENAQRKVEGRNFDIRKNLLEYDDVANDQRRVVYHQRNSILETDDLSTSIVGVREDVISELVYSYMPAGTMEEQWDLEGLSKVLAAEFNCNADISAWLKEDSKMHIDGVIERLTETLVGDYAAKEKMLDERGFDAGELRKVERHVMLQTLDRHWKDHLAGMDHLRQGIHLRGYAQKNPKQEYKREAFELFQHMMNQTQHQVIRILHTLEMRRDDEVEQLEKQREEEARRQLEQMKLQQPSLNPEGDVAPQQEGAAQPAVRSGRKVGRNELCPCGSGKKFKHCHGALEV